jgi:hypothetical protein
MGKVRRGPTTGFRVQEGTASGRVQGVHGELWHAAELEEMVGNLGRKEDLGPQGQRLLEQVVEHLARNVPADRVPRLLRVAGTGRLRRAAERELLARSDKTINARLVEHALLTETLEALYREAGPRDRRVVRLLLARIDATPSLMRELAEEAVLRGVKLETDLCYVQQAADVRARISRQLAPELERLSLLLGQTVTAETLTDPRVRRLVARQVRHARNLTSMRPEEVGRRRRAEVLFERSFTKACTKLSYALKAEREERERVERERLKAMSAREREYERKYGRRTYTPRRKRTSYPASLGGQAGLPARTEAELTPAGEHPQPHPDSRPSGLPDLGCSRGTCLDDADSRAALLAVSGRGCTGCGEEAQKASGGRALWADDLVRRAAKARTSRAWCDEQGRTIWADGPLLAEALCRHEELPDAVLAGIKRAAYAHGGHQDPCVPLPPGDLLTRMGPDGLSTLLRRLRTVRVQWPAAHRPPRYIRNIRSGVEWRPAARFLVKGGSELAWLLDTPSGEDLSPDAARCALLLGPEVLAELSGQEIQELLCAAAGWSFGGLLDVTAALREAGHAKTLDVAAALLAGDLAEAEREIAVKMCGNWQGAIAELIELAKII